MNALTADGLREAFTKFFVDRGHVALPAASLIPHDPSVMFNIAGMLQFKPYFLGLETPPAPRATTIQPSFRMSDIEEIGLTDRHVTLFEMLGNFSFGDYFKQDAIAWGWELVTEVLGFDGDTLWVTVHETDDEAIEIWHDSIGVPLDRIQRMGEDNFWTMGPTGPCGPCSEIYADRGPELGAAGGPAFGGPERYVEIWNLVFMQYDRAADGTLSDLPKKNIDTGAGLERILALLQGVGSVFDTDGIRPLVDKAAELTTTTYGRERDTDVALRILADHARSATFLISDGVFPSNEGRGYVLRRVIRRGILRAYQLGARELVMPTLTAQAIETMGRAYPKLVRDSSLVETIVAHEEEAFLRTLRSGTQILDTELALVSGKLGGDVAFRLHDTFGFPIDLTVELAGERGVAVDRQGFEVAMTEQRERARAAGKAAAKGGDADVTAEKELLSEFGATEFLGYRELESLSRVLAVVESGDDAFLYLDRTPFYAEGGGQVGDTGTITTATGVATVTNTTKVLDGLIRHWVTIKGSIDPGAEARAVIDGERRESIRRNHTGTHLLHSALREVLGTHVAQQGSLVAPDRLRFDFSHFAAVTPEEIDRIESLVNSRVIANEPVRTYETTKSEAESSGAIAFFGDKYGDVVRVVEAGGESVELCGGTHVSALGMIGPIKIVSESSIGANTRRIEALTGARSLERMRTVDRTLESAAALLKSPPQEVPEALERVLARQRRSDDEIKALRAGQIRADAEALAAAAVDGVVVGRKDGLDANQLRDLAVMLRDRPEVDAVGLVGSPDGSKVSLVVAVVPARGLDAGGIVGAAAKLVGGGGGGSPELATAGGRDASAIEAALDKLRADLVPSAG